MLGYSKLRQRGKKVGPAKLKKKQKEKLLDREKPT